ncbi:SRPBCC family protein [Sporosarcina luteola]|uniref:SRPBCC family protein n=1 Tax=Sporosarcina luteola TaxID=582850 RepID=UPI00203CFA53|nr:SRPBCC family protein [Sporosarcina luteola]
MGAFEELTVEATVQAPVEKVWDYWTDPNHIKKWNSPSDDWHTPFAENDLRVGGKFVSRMEAKDGSMGFDFGGVYDEVKLHEKISYTMGDGRKVNITFTGQGNETEVIETFEAETENPVEFQRQGWQAILDNFKRYAEQTYQSF